MDKNEFSEEESKFPVEKDKKQVEDKLMGLKEKGIHSEEDKVKEKKSRNLKDILEYEDSEETLDAIDNNDKECRSMSIRSLYKIPIVSIIIAGILIIMGVLNFRNAGSSTDNFINTVSITLGGLLILRVILHKARKIK